MTDRLTPEREAEIIEQIKQALSDAGAFCGDYCSFEPGDRGCPDCEKCYESYANALMPILHAVAANPHTPRLCACGHSHLAHTVPAPHSCFALGQTCPCRTYRQLPRDEAVAQLERNRQVAAERVRKDDDPAHCLSVHEFSPRDGWRMVCGNCDHSKTAPCHRVGGTR